MIGNFPELKTTAIIQTKTTGSGTTNGTWSDGESITGILTQSTGTESIVNESRTTTVNAMFHYSGAEAITEKNRLKINGTAYMILYKQVQKDLETGSDIKIFSLKVLR